MQERKVVLTWEAIYDITDIANYIEAKFGITRADQFQSEIHKKIKDLELFGTMFLKTNLLYRSYSIYQKPFPPSIIFYIIKEPENKIHVLRIIWEERDWEKLLMYQQSYTYP